MTRPPADDIDRLMAIMDTAFDPHFREAWTRRQVEDALLVGNCHYALADQHGQPDRPGDQAAGFCLSRTGVEEEELLLFAVSPDHRQRGIGRAMLVRLAADARARGARTLFLEMRKGNPAEALYRRFGFCPIGERRDYYRTANGETIDAITFALPL